MPIQPRPISETMGPFLPSRRCFMFAWMRLPGQKYRFVLPPSCLRLCHTSGGEGAFHEEIVSDTFFVFSRCTRRDLDRNRSRRDVPRQRRCQPYHEMCDL